MKRYLVIALALALAIAAGLFAVRNTTPIDVDLYFAHVEGPLVLWLLAAVGLGVMLSLLCMLPGWWRERASQRRLRRELADAKAECDRLRRAPLEDR